MVEYVGIQNSTKLYGKKNLLYCEMELLSTIKRYQRYKKLRKQELALKTIFKRRIRELKEEVKMLDKDLLPKIKMPELREPGRLQKSHEERNKLEKEIDEIKRKIAMLSAEQ